MNVLDKPFEEIPQAIIDHVLTDILVFGAVQSDTERLIKSQSKEVRDYIRSYQLRKLLELD